MARKAKTATRWAIVGTCGLYCGQWLRRRDAIAEHVYGFDQKLFDAGKRSAWNELNADQERAWEKRQRAGDRVIKVLITFPAPPVSQSGEREGG